MSHKPNRPSSLDVAKLAGVSQAAVSRAFTPHASISDTTKTKVMDAARSLGYRPNALPRMIATSRSNLVALIMGEIANPFYTEVLALLLQELHPHGLHPLIFSLKPGQIADDVISEVFKYRVDGLLITSATLSAEQARECQQLDVPVVLFNRHVDDDATLSICCDNVAEGRRVADLLLDAGHRHPALMGGNPSDLTDQERELGFVGRLRERGIRHVPRHFGPNTYEDGVAGARAFMQLNPRPDAVFCVSDLVALGALDEIRHAQGLRVPEDVSIIGFDNIPQARWLSYNLTTLSQPIAAMVRDSVRLLVSRIKGEAGEQYDKLVLSQLIEGGTARLP